MKSVTRNEIATKQSRSFSVRYTCKTVRKLFGGLDEMTSGLIIFPSSMI